MTNRNNILYRRLEQDYLKCRGWITDYTKTNNKKVKRLAGIDSLAIEGDQIWEEDMILYKKLLQKYEFKYLDWDHSWGSYIGSGMYRGNELERIKNRIQEEFNKNVRPFEPAIVFKEDKE